jgi:hypothetical protein
MKRLRQLCAVTVLTIIFTNVASADEGILHPGYMPPPPPPPPASNSGILHPGLTTNQVELKSEEATIDLATEMTLLLIQNMLVLF